MKKSRRHVGDDALALMAAAKAHKVLGVCWLPAALHSRAVWDPGSRSFFCVLIGACDFALGPLDRPQGQGHVGLYQVAVALGDGDGLYYDVQPLEVAPLAGGDPLTFDSVELLDALWAEGAVDVQEVEPLDADP